MASPIDDLLAALKSLPPEASLNILRAYSSDRYSKGYTAGYSQAIQDIRKKLEKRIAEKSS